MSGVPPTTGGAAQFTATAVMSDSSSRQVTADASWTSSNSAVATVEGGLVRGVSPGEVEISANYQNVKGSLAMAIVAPLAQVKSVSVSGTAPRVGETSQFAATATLADNSVSSVTSLATWRSSNTSTATVAAGGVVTGVAAGEADITATYQNTTGTTHVVVTAPQTSPAPAPAACSFSVSPATLAPTSAGGVFTVSVTVLTGSNCSWTATSGDSFVTIISGAAGTGNGVTGISVAANTGAARSGALTIAGKQVTVSQPEGSCVTLVNPGGVQYPAQLWRGKITVTAVAGCQWTAISTAPFITFLSSASGVGSGSVSYLVSGNLTAASRSGAITVKDKTLNIAQRAAAGGMTLSFLSDAGDVVGQGWTAEFELPYASIVPSLDPSRNHISFRIGDIIDDLGTMSWTLDLAAPQGQQLRTGTYTNAARYGFQLAASPGLAFSGNGRACNTVTGQFTITDAVFNADGSVQRFVASFEQHCDGAGPALRGNITWVR